MDAPEVVGELFIYLIDSNIIQIETSPETATFYASIVLCMMQTFGDMIFKNKLQVLKFVKSQLLDSDDGALALGLTLLKQLVSDNTSGEIELVLKDIRIILQTLLVHSSEEIRTLAREARMKCIDCGYRDESRVDSERFFRESLLELRDELLPIRAHGMSKLKQLVLSSDPVATENLDSILMIFLDLLDDADSFIYLNAVKGLNALGEMYHKRVMNHIATRYEDESFSVEYRLRLGEAFLQIIQKFGKLLEAKGNSWIIQHQVSLRRYFLFFALNMWSCEEVLLFCWLQSPRLIHR